ncbi:cell wall-active antibiotics response protein LiaF [Paenibacillus crassostreae]|uniref:Cell wall-active antibiotics response protein n=1 Tax=Paenibacillus crassostreae TaxID=1763538 RepID=A0A167GT52_9BACL|nr:cell wall-active antibiotics response protein LiaF [Paenibacillus crassostreae]OAB77875.1 hypothetical protein PNBC_00490 [Paenibacillus crassostreae]
MKKGWIDRFFGGLVLIGIGVVFLLQQMDWIDISIGSIISTYWPLILIYAGLKNIMTLNEKGSSLVGGFILLAIGGYFQSRELDLISVTPGDFFKFLIPIFLIVGGLVVIFKPQHKRSHSDNRMNSPITPVEHPPEPSELPSLHHLSDLPDGESQSTLDKQFEEKFGMHFDDKISSNSEDTKGYTNHERHHDNDDRKKRYKFNENHGEGKKINKSIFIGDIHMGRDYFELKPTNISQFIGDTVLDLTKAQIPYGKTTINISAFIGDIKIYVPDDMDLGIKVSANSFIGDMTILSESKSGFISTVSSSTPYYKDAQKRININISAFIGDIKVNTVA